jgi:hypothetical protein
MAVRCTVVVLDLLLQEGERQVQRDLLLSLFTHDVFQGDERVWNGLHWSDDVFDGLQSPSNVDEGDNIVILPQTRADNGCVARGGQET